MNLANQGKRISPGGLTPLGPAANRWVWQKQSPAVAKRLRVHQTHRFELALKPRLLKPGLQAEQFLRIRVS